MPESQGILLSEVKLPIRLDNSRKYLWQLAKLLVFGNLQVKSETHLPKCENEVESGEASIHGVPLYALCIDQ